MRKKVGCLVKRGTFRYWTFKKEIIYQIVRSKSFRKLIFDNNGFYINKEDIDYIELWYEWNFIRGKQDQLNKKWVNNIYNETNTLNKFIT